jgi:translation initiation factor 2 alpha subunit (eIF-2alpha)
MNRQERKAVDRQAKRSIQEIKNHLEWLNQTGNPKYKLVVQSTFEYKAKNVLRRMAFWR